MNVRDLIDELQKFPELSSVFIQSDNDDSYSPIRPIDSIHEVWVKGVDPLSGPFQEIEEDETGRLVSNADAYGALIYG